MFFADAEPADVHRMEAVNVFVRINGFPFPLQLTPFLWILHKKGWQGLRPQAQRRGMA